MELYHHLILIIFINVIFTLLIFSPDKFIYALPDYDITQNQNLENKLNFKLYDITLENTFYDSKLLSFKLPTGWGITHENEQLDFLHLDFYPKNGDHA